MKALAIFISLFFYLNLLNASLVHVGFADELFSPNTIKAAENGSLEDLKKAFNELVKPGKDINELEKGFDYTSLYFAALKGKADMVDFLLEKGADPNARIYSGETALMASVRYPEIAKKLIEAGADPNVKAKGYFTALQSAVSLAEPKSIDMLIEKGADVNVRTEDGRSLFHLVSERFERMVVNKTPDNKGSQYSFYTVNEEYRLEIARLLLDKGLDPSLIDKKGKTALHEAAEKNRPELAEFFLRNNVDVNAKDEKGKTALHWAAQMGSPKVAELLLANGAEHRVLDLNGWNPLHYASANADFESGKILLEQTFDLNEKNKEGNTALHLLAFGQSDYVMTDSQKSFRKIQEQVFGETMGQLKASTKKSDPANFQGSSLAAKVQDRFNKNYQKFLRAKAPLMARDFFKTEKNAIRFYQATQKNRMDFMSLLIEEGINVDEQNNRGNTALHMVSRSKLKEKKEVTRLLIQQKANLNIINHEGEMALSNRRILGEFVYATFSSRPNARALYEKSKGFLGRRFKVRR